MSLRNYLKKWFKDFFGIASHELSQIYHDGGVMLIFVVACLAYPLLYNLVYLHGTLDDTPIAVVDDSNCAESRRYIREVDATREAKLEYKCVSMPEAEKLMQERKVKGIMYFPSDFGDKLARRETATISIYCDMSSFLYYKNLMMSVNHVMLQELGDIQLERYSALGMTDAEAMASIKPVPYEENNPYNNSFAYNIFLISAILMLIIQQTMFYGMSMLAGTMREQNRSFASLPDRLSGVGMGRIVLGRGAAYWIIYLAISLYIAFIVPAIFGIPQRGNFWDILIMLLFYITDCVFFSMFFSSQITRRESVFVLFLFMSPVCLFLSGTSWPTSAFPGFWKVFSYIFPSTFGVQAFMNLNTAGGDLMTVETQLDVMTLQTVIYFALASIAVYVENWVIKNKSMFIKVKREIAESRGIDLIEDARIIGGEASVQEINAKHSIKN